MAPWMGATNSTVPGRDDPTIAQGPGHIPVAGADTVTSQGPHSPGDKTKKRPSRRRAIPQTRCRSHEGRRKIGPGVGAPVSPPRLPGPRASVRAHSPGERLHQPTYDQDHHHQNQEEEEASRHMGPQVRSPLYGRACPSNSKTHAYPRARLGMTGKRRPPGGQRCAQANSREDWVSPLGDARGPGSLAWGRTEAGSQGRWGVARQRQPRCDRAFPATLSGPDFGGCAQAGRTSGRTRRDSTSWRVSGPFRISTSSRAKSMAVPGPREVVSLPSRTTGSSR